MSAVPTEITIHQIEPGSANQILGVNNAGTSNEWKTLSGTPNQIAKTDGVGTIIFSTPQDIALSSSPTFASETLTNTTNQLSLGTTRLIIVNAPTPASTSRTVTIPDPGAAANFVLSESSQTLNGALTLTSALAITPTTNQLVLGTTRTVTISAVQPATSSRIYTIPDQGSAANFVLDQANYTISGTWNFAHNVTLQNQSATVYQDLSLTPKSVTIEAPDTVTTSYLLKWPVAQSSGTQVLQNDGSGNLSWSSSTGGATTALDNLSAVAINTSLLPGSDNTIDLGSSSKNFRSAYLKTSLILQQTGVGTNAITIAPPASITSHTLTLPAAQGTVNTILLNDGSGNLSWSSGITATFREDYIVGTPSGNYTGSLTVFNLLNSYVVGSNTLIVTLDGDVQTKGGTIDYVETSSTIVTFNNSLVSGQKVSFIFPAPITSLSPSGVVNSGSQYQLAYYAASGTTLSGNNNLTTNSSGQLLVTDGTVSLPGYSFAADTDAGLYRIGADDIAISTNGIKQLEISTTAVTSALPLAMGSNKITGVANGTAASDAAAFGQIYYGFQAPVQFTTNTSTSVTSNTYTATALTASISPTSSSHRIKITISGLWFLSDNSRTYNLTIERGTTNLAGSSGFLSYYTGSLTGADTMSVGISYIDSPATTSSTSYTVYIKNDNNTSATSFPGGGVSVTGVMILEEIV